MTRHKLIKAVEIERFAAIIDKSSYTILITVIVAMTVWIITLVIVIMTMAVRIITFMVVMVLMLIMMMMLVMMMLVFLFHIPFYTLNPCSGSSYLFKIK